MKQSIFKVETNKKIAKDVYEMTLSGDTCDITATGQFVNIKLEGMFLRRPISVCDFSDNYLKLIYKVVGHGTEYMASLEKGAELEILTGLGNGYDTEKSGDAPLLIGGGVGVPPMYALAKKLIKEGKRCRSYSALTVAPMSFMRMNSRRSAALWQLQLPTVHTAQKDL